jgi:hypothetical protein
VYHTRQFEDIDRKPLHTRIQDPIFTWSCFSGVRERNSTLKKSTLKEIRNDR